MVSALDSGSDGASSSRGRGTALCSWARPSLHSKRFQSSYWAKVRAEAPFPSPVILFFFALVPAF